MKCPTCGTAVDSGDRHCRECGQDLVQPQVASPSGKAEEPASSAVPTSAVPTSAAPSGRSIEDIALGVGGLVVAGILWVLVLAGYPSGLTYVGLLIAAASGAKLWRSN